MVCVYCGNETKVDRTKQINEGDSIERSRTCLRCKGQFKTSEAVTKLYMIARGKRIEIDYSQIK